jgi:glycine/D-amino acid oxidase-like deaminating enzyme
MTSFWPEGPPTPDERASYADAEPRPYWLANLPPRDPAPALHGAQEADLCIVGGGFTGLWAALHAKADDPGRDVVVLEADTVGFGASGRNGGFLSYSLTHGIANGLSRFEDEMPALERLGMGNFDDLRADLATHGIDCGLETTGDLVVILEPYQDAWVEEETDLLPRFGHDVEVFDGPAMRREVASPTYRAGVWDRTGMALVDPARLADGLRAAAQRLGVRINEHTPADALRVASGLIDVPVPTAASARAGSCSPRARTRRCCARSAATSCRSTTTRS